MIVLETERLLIREFAESDAAAFYVLGSDPEIIRFTGDPGGGLKDLRHAREVLRSHPMADYRKYGFGRWACVLKASGEIIGFAGLKYLNDLDEVDLGYRLLPAHWGVGLATEAGRAVLDHGFSRLGLERIIGLVDPRNGASENVLRKLGMRFAEMIDYDGMTVSKYAIGA